MKTGRTWRSTAAWGHPVDPPFDPLQPMTLRKTSPYTTTDVKFVPNNSLGNKHTVEGVMEVESVAQCRRLYQLMIVCHG